MAWVQLIVGGALIVIGLLIMCAGVIGVYRFHYVLNRMHASAMVDSMGILFAILGLAVLSGFQFGTLKLVSSHMICKLEVLVNEDLEKECEVPEDGRI